MFKVPDWEEDVPKSKIDHMKRPKNTKKPQKNTDKLASPWKLNKVHVPAVKQAIKGVENVSQAKKRKRNGQIINNKKKKADSSNNNIDISNIDMDRLDEVLLDAKKKKFYEPMKRDDVEHQLFKETKTGVSQTPVTLSSKGKQLIKIMEKKVKKHKKVKINSQKNKTLIEPENDKPKKVFQVQENNENNEVKNFSVQIGNRPVNKKKENIKKMLQNHTTRTSITVNGNKLRERMLERLKAAQFRFINEKLYTSSGTEAKELFQSDPAAFQTYHQGYQQQLKKWPVNPLDVIVKRIQKMPKTHIIADMGCGEAALSKRIHHTVRSFDLVSTAPGVEICDMAHTPLLAESVDAAVYCLALMGTELTQYLLEANRVLKMGGHLLIAEVESRFDDADAFAKEVMKLGFKLKNLDKKHTVFFFMEFTKTRDPPAKKSRLPVLTLKPCLYKRR